MLHVHGRGRWLRLGLTFLGLGAAAAALVSAQEKPPTFPSAVEIVTVDVVVTDKQGSPIAGLGQADFTLREDGARQEITAFEAVSAGGEEMDPAAAPANPRVSTNLAAPSRPPATFVIVFDEPHLDHLQASRGKRALEGFLKGVVREGDRLRLVAAGRFALEGTRERLLEELPRLEGRRVHDETPEAMSDYEAMRVTLFDDQPLMLRIMERMAVLSTGRHPDLSEGERIRNASAAELGLRLDEGHVRAIARGVYQDAVARNRATLRSLQTAIDDAAAIRGRKSVVLVSAGMIHDPELDGYRQVIDAARRANAALYFVDVRSLEGIPGAAAEHGTSLAGIDQGIVMMSRALGGAGAEGLAADSGGFTVKNQNDLLDSLRRIATESRSYYLLGYTPPPGRANGKLRKIEVEVRRPGVEVRARKGYYAGASVAAGAATAPIPLRLSAYVYGESIPGRVQTLVVADADPDALSLQEREGRFLGRLEIGVVVTPQAGGEPAQFGQQVELNLSAERRRALGRRWLPIRRRFDLAPGGYLAQFAVRDLGSGRLGTVSHPFEVPAPSFRISTPVLSDALEGGPGGPNGVPAVGARRAFPEQSTLYFQFEVYGAAIDPARGEPRVSSSYSVRDRAGVEWAHAEPGWIGTSTGGVQARVGEIGITFEPGDYDLVVNVKDEVAGRSLEVREPFSVEPAR